MYKFYSVREKCVKCINIKFYFPWPSVQKCGPSPLLLHVQASTYCISVYVHSYICVHTYMDRLASTRGLCFFHYVSPVARVRQQQQREDEQLLRPRINAKRFTCGISRIQKEDALHRKNARISKHIGHHVQQ